jgi:hypothetical protein
VSLLLAPNREKPRLSKSSQIALWAESLTWIDFACWLAIAAGVGLRMVAFHFNRALWVDEAMLSLNLDSQVKVAS